MFRILFIEGNDQDAERIQNYYESDPGKRFECVRVPTLREGLAQIQNPSQIWDMTLMDLALPDSDGVLSFDQAIEKNTGVPVVVISSESDEDQGIAMVQRGAQDYLLKTHLDAHWLIRTTLHAIERKKMQSRQASLERQIRDSQKSESLSLLAAGIAHDFNNLLTTIRGYTSLGLMKIGPNSEIRNNLEQIDMAASKAADLSSQMLAYSGASRFVLEFVNLNDLIYEARERNLFTETETTMVQYELNDPLPQVRVDSTEIELALTHLVKNAVEAIGENIGLVTLRTGTKTIELKDEEQARKENYWGVDSFPVVGDFVFIAVEDTGGGLHEDTMANMFDPFYTTKFMGRGLGLSATLGIMRGHKGMIHVETEISKGSSFQLLFPLTPALLRSSSATRPRSLVHAPTELPRFGNNRTILVVDDEESILDIAKNMLERLELKVKIAANGEDALTILEEDPQDIDLVILDMIMPTMGGEETFEEIRKIRRDLPIIICTGYSESEMKMNFSSVEFDDYLKKPYSFQNLVKKVADLLPPVEV